MIFILYSCLFLKNTLSGISKGTLFYIYTHSRDLEGPTSPWDGTQCKERKYQINLLGKRASGHWEHFSQHLIIISLMSMGHCVLGKYVINLILWNKNSSWLTQIIVLKVLDLSQGYNSWTSWMRICITRQKKTIGCKHFVDVFLINIIHFLASLVSLQFVTAACYLLMVVFGEQ